MPVPPKDPQYFIDKMWSLIDKDGPGGCWLYTGRLTIGGYGQRYMGGGSGAPKPFLHRVTYELLVGPIPDGYDIDHLCRVRNCVNPAHLEPVTHQENILRGDTFAARNAAKTHCPKGHPLVVAASGNYARRCVPCHAAGTPNGDKTHCKWGHKTCRIRRTTESNRKVREARKAARAAAAA